jgi:hypothetical protein
MSPEHFNSPFTAFYGLVSHCSILSLSSFVKVFESTMTMSSPLPLDAFLANLIQHFEIVDVFSDNAQLCKRPMIKSTTSSRSSSSSKIQPTLTLTSTRPALTRLDIINALLQEPVEESDMRKKERDVLSLGIVKMPQAPHWTTVWEPKETNIKAPRRKKLKKASSARTFKQGGSTTRSGTTTATLEGKELFLDQDNSCPFTLKNNKGLRKHMNKASSEPSLTTNYYCQEEYSFHLFLDQEDEEHDSPSTQEEVFQVSRWIRKDKDYSQEQPKENKKKTSIGSNVLMMARDRARASLEMAKMATTHEKRIVAANCA